MRPAHLDELSTKKKRAINRRKHNARTGRQNYERMRNIMRNNLRKGHRVAIRPGNEPILLVGARGLAVQGFDTLISGMPIRSPKSRKFHEASSK